MEILSKKIELPTANFYSTIHSEMERIVSSKLTPTFTILRP